MNKLTLKQSLSQKLSPQQIQFIKLLEVPTFELESRIASEIEMNPAIEEITAYEHADEQSSEDENSDDSFDQDAFSNNSNSDEDNLHLENYLGADDKGYKMSGDGNYDDESEKENLASAESTLLEKLEEQLSFLNLDERKYQIGLQLIGSIEEDGYIHRKMDAIVNDLAFNGGIDTSKAEVEEILFLIQQFEPAGIAARDLQECLILQLKRRPQGDEHVELALKILETSFEEFMKKHFDKILKKFEITEEKLKEVMKVITRCNPKPGQPENKSIISSEYLIPDFILTNNNGVLEVTLHATNAPQLRVSRSYLEMFDTYEKSSKKDKKMKEAVTFVKQKLDAARWFIDAIKQRQNTLLQTMKAILSYQYEYFLEGDESKLKPMILKDIADKVHMDISTISRVVNSKTVQTDFGVYPLKYFFSEGIITESGEDVSTREVKNIIQEIINKEDKSRPLSDEELENILKKRGFFIARRTVAKYREQMGIPVARLRKEL